MSQQQAQAALLRFAQTASPQEVAKLIADLLKKPAATDPELVEVNQVLTTESWYTLVLQRPALVPPGTVNHDEATAKTEDTDSDEDSVEGMGETHAARARGSRKKNG